MTESPPNTPPNSNSQHETIPTIPIEFVSEEEMALIEAAYAATRSSLSSSSSSSICSPTSRFQTRSRTIHSITLLSKRGLNGSSELDIEDSDYLKNPQKRIRVAQSFLHRFRRKRALSVTDITATVVKKVKVHIESVEDRWALKFINFITCANQLLFEGITRELPLVGFVEGIWLVGVIDELRMPENGSDRNPILVDTKTRVRDTLPAEPQSRNGRLQLMCYKYLWDTLVANSFASGQFFDFFSLNRNYMLSKDIRERTASSGFPAKTLDDVIQYYINTCSMLPISHDRLLLRYELQKDQSVLGEDEFAYDPDWLKRQIQSNLEFWLGEREASYTPQEERWKCRHCQFASICSGNPFPNIPRGSSSSSDYGSSSS
ncbi:putative exonuclease V [Gossypium arboreum]|uniref:Putative exonuclease V n=1 Tax=Gossypium arboreum TaxID=29729 RepID=A0A0B0MSE7_GOSAR|nr:putative exonuclease V [Gossypium arboreum]